MRDKYWHIKFPQGWDITLKNAWIRIEQLPDDNYSLGQYEFFLENTDKLSFNVDTIFNLYNNMLNIDYIVKVKKTYDNSLALEILEWAEH